MRPLNATFLFSFLAVSAILDAQTSPDTLRFADLSPVTVTAYRLEQTDIETPLALTTIGEYRLQHGQQQLALDEALAAVPGVHVQNAGNFAQDLRVSIRGFGARSAFGIRGIKILMDGFPESTPDGQAQVDNIDPAAITAANVIRGAASGLYGNASGGYINFNTLKFTGKNFTELGARWGSYGFQKYSARTVGGKPGKLRYNVTGALTETDGFREHSTMKNYLVNSGLYLPLDDASHLVVALNFVSSPIAQDAGGVGLEQATQQPRQARDKNLLFEAGEKLWQGRLGLAYTRQLRNAQKLTARLYHTHREFSNKLPFENGGQVQLTRGFSGASLNFSKKKRVWGIPVESSAGAEVEWQSDDRQRYNNLTGQRGPQSLNQKERFFILGVHLTQRWPVTKRLHISPGLRFDVLGISVGDRFMADGNDSGERHFTRVSPIAGVVYAVSKTQHLYANFSTNFETPALSELSANPAGGGFNPNLLPQKARSVELGFKGLSVHEKFRYELAVFHIELQDELIPFELENFPGRAFYRNAASSARTGVEAGLGTFLGHGFYTYINYTYSHFAFSNYRTGTEVFDGNAVPGIPRHLAYAELRYFKTTGFYGSFTAQYIGTQPANDANDTFTDAYILTNMRWGFVVKRRRMEWEPFFGVNNLFDTRYFSNIRINAFGGRYYEAAPGIHVFGGLKWRLSRQN
ncbi:MAG: TonB-dependent receptor family protein [Saprospiraceae bacterium]